MPVSKAIHRARRPRWEYEKAFDPPSFTAENKTPSAAEETETDESAAAESASDDIDHLLLGGIRSWLIHSPPPRGSAAWKTKKNEASRANAIYKRPAERKRRHPAAEILSDFGGPSGRAPAASQGPGASSGLAALALLENLGLRKGARLQARASSARPRLTPRAHAHARQACRSNASCIRQRESRRRRVRDASVREPSDGPGVAHDAAARRAGRREAPMVKVVETERRVMKSDRCPQWNSAAAVGVSL